MADQNSNEQLQKHYAKKHRKKVTGSSYDVEAINALNAKVEAVTNPSPNKKSFGVFFSEYWWFWLILLIVVFIGGIVFSSCDEYKENQAYVKENGSISEARITARRIIETSLKAPSTANITFTESTPMVNIYRFNGYVDAQNSFGAKIRNQFFIELEFKDGKYNLLKIEFN